MKNGFHLFINKVRVSYFLMQHNPNGISGIKIRRNSSIIVIRLDIQSPVVVK
jgi:hypothetical protein